MIDTPNEFWNIYKYTSFEVGEAIVSNCCLKFTDPKYFNDPFDCDFNGIYFDLDGAIDVKVKQEIEGLKRMLSPKKLTNNFLINVYTQTIAEKLQNSVATCFSLDNNNHLMWSHYANNHAGMCLGFDNSIPIKEKFIDLKLGLEGPMVYGFNEKINFCAHKITGNQRLYLTKLGPWKYEKEYRYVAVADEGLYHFKKEFLKNIVFGLRTKEEQINRIIRLCKRVNIDVEIFKTEINGSQLIYKELRLK